MENEIKKYIEIAKEVDRFIVETGALALGIKLANVLFPTKSFMSIIGKVTVSWLVYESLCANVIYSDAAVEQRDATFDTAEEKLEQIFLME